MMHEANVYHAAKDIADTTEDLSCSFVGLIRFELNNAKYEWT